MPYVVCPGSESTGCSLQDVCVLLIPFLNKDVTGLMSFLLLEGLQDVPCPSQHGCVALSSLASSPKQYHQTAIDPQVL